MDEEKRVTLKYISQILNVTPTTVANALNGQPNVSDKLRRMIIKEAKQLGYKPNVNAKAMVKNGISIALLLSEEPEEFIFYLKKGIYAAIEELSDFKVYLTEFTYHDLRSTLEANDCVNRMTQNKHDGLLLFPSFDKESYFDTLKEYIEDYDIPVVYLYDTLPEIPYISTVSVNSEGIGKLVAQFIHLVFGEAKVGVITTTKKFMPHQKTVETFLAECEQYGIEVVDVLYNNDNKTETYSCTDNLISEHPEIDVIYKTSFDCIQVCKCLLLKGLQDKIKVIAHDVFAGMQQYMKNGQLLATVFQNQQVIGRQSVRTLFNAIMGDIPVEKNILIRPELVLKSNLENYPV